MNCKKFLLVFLSLLALAAPAATVNFAITNSDTTPYNGLLWVYPVRWNSMGSNQAPGILADGSYMIGGVPSLVRMTNGTGSTQLMKGPYLSSNQVVYYSFSVPLNTGIYQAESNVIGGGNIFVYQPGFTPQNTSNQVAAILAAQNITTNPAPMFVSSAGPNFYSWLGTNNSLGIWAGFTLGIDFPWAGGAGLPSFMITSNGVFDGIEAAGLHTTGTNGVVTQIVKATGAPAFIDSVGSLPRSDTIVTNNSATTLNDVSVGSGASSSGGAQSVSYGGNATAGGSTATAIGHAANATQSDSTAVGNGATATGINSLAIGYGAAASANTATAVGEASTSAFTHSTALGVNSTADAANQVMLGTINDTVVAPSNAVVRGVATINAAANVGGLLSVTGQVNSAAMTVNNGLTGAVIVATATTGFIGAGGTGLTNVLNGNPVLPEKFGAINDGVELRSIVGMTNGSAVVTCSAANFQAGDVGKVAVIYQDTTNRTWIVSAIASWQSGTQITLTSNSTFTAAGTGTLVYGTDNTTAISNAVNACFNAGGGVVQFQKGMYVMAGGVASNALHEFSVIHVPQQSITAPKFTITLEGDPVGRQLTYYGLGNEFANAGGTILYCPTKRPGSGLQTNSYYCVFGANYNNGYGGVAVGFKHLTIRQPVDPQLSAIYGQWAGGIRLENAAIDTDIPSTFFAVESGVFYPIGCADGTDVSNWCARAVIFPGNANDADCKCADSVIFNYGAGVVGCDHMSTFNTEIESCHDGMILGYPNDITVNGGAPSRAWGIHLRANINQLCALNAGFVGEVDYQGMIFEDDNIHVVNNILDPGKKLTGHISYSPNGGKRISCVSPGLSLINTKDGSISPTPYAENFILKNSLFCNLSTFGSDSPFFISGGLSIRSNQQCNIYNKAPSVSLNPSTVSQVYLVGLLATTNLSVGVIITAVEFNTNGFNNVSTASTTVTGLTNLVGKFVLLTNAWTWSSAPVSRVLQMAIGSVASPGTQPVTNDVFLGDWSISSQGYNQFGH